MKKIWGIRIFLLVIFYICIFNITIFPLNNIFQRVNQKPSMAFFANVERLIEQKRKQYSEYPKTIIADFKGEERLKGDYANRQILELLQNADDAASPKVLIKLACEEENPYLLFANTGKESFSERGVESLMLANYSSKIKRTYIGNKGLGFRSILNWADEVHIVTQGCLLKFSQSIAKEELDNLNIDKQLFEDNGYNPQTIPFPIFAIPTIEPLVVDNCEWTTQIKIFYKADVEQSIKQQLQDFKVEILLFLNYIDTVIIDINDTPLSIIRNKEQKKGFISIEDREWEIVSNNNEPILLPDKYQDNKQIEQEYFSLKVALQAGLTDKFNKLFNFFPTTLSISLPCIIHGTFDLDSSRNHINPTAKNEFILDELVLLLEKIAIDLTKRDLNWEAYRLLTPIESTESPLIQKFYEKLTIKRDQLPIYPCIDGNYRYLNSVKFYTFEFSEWVYSNGYEIYFPELVFTPFEELSLLDNKRYEATDFQSKVNELSQAICLDKNSIEKRANLISLLLDDTFINAEKLKYNLLINNENIVIRNESVAYTPVQLSEKKFDKPEFVYFDFISQDLYEVLIHQHKEGFDASHDSIARQFQHYFEKIVNVSDYEFAKIIRKILSETKKHLNNNPVESHIAIVKNMVIKLYKNYLLIESKDKSEIFSNTDSFLLINRKGNVVESDTLYLNATYPSGILTEELYEGILFDNNYLANIDFFGIDDDNLYDIEAFFIWLGVNKYVKFNKIAYPKNGWEWRQDPYLEFVFNKVNRPDPVTQYNFSGLSIGVTEYLKKLSREKLLVLMIKEDKLLSILEGHSADILSHKYGNRNLAYINEKPSYIQYQLSSISDFKNYVIENNNITFINKELQIDQNYILFEKYSITKSDLERILIRLGAKQNFSELNEERVYELLAECSQLDKEKKYCRQLYNLAFEYFKGQKDISQKQKDFSVLAIKEARKEYRHVSEVYYSDNVTLPNKLLKNYWIFDFPKRKGELQIASFFGINTFKDIKIESQLVINHPCQIEFNEWFNKLKPYILAYRIQSLNYKDQNIVTNNLKKYQISLASSAQYRVDDNEWADLETNEFIENKKGQTIICGDKNKSLAQLRQIPEFCEAFAELICLLFKVTDNKNVYRSFFKDDIEHTEFTIKSDGLDSYLNEARRLLGISPIELEFWQNVFQIKGKDLNKSIDNKKTLKEILKKDLNLDLSIDSVLDDLDKITKIETIEFLKSLCKQAFISLKDIQIQNSNFKGLFNWHYELFTNESFKLEDAFKKALWNTLNKQNINEQRKFIEIQKTYKVKAESISREISRKLMFLFDIDYKTLFYEEIEKVYSDYSLCMDENILQEVSLKQLYDWDEQKEELNDSDRSLFYFAGHEEIIQKILNDVNIIPVSTTNTSLTLPIINIVKVGWQIGKLPSNKLTVGSIKSPISYNSKKEQAQKKAGKNAELLVKAALNDKGYELIHVSSNNDESMTPDDSLGYDFMYKKQGTHIFNFLEVKSMSGDSFIMSANELEKGIKYKEKYHLALVKDNKINLITDFFKNSNVHKEFDIITSTQLIRPHNFEIYLQITANQDELELEYDFLDDEDYSAH